jgi:hypothetical protein
MYKGIVFMQTNSIMNGLPQAGILSNKLLTKHVSKHGYYQTPDTPSLWTHSDYPVLFSLLVDNFAVKYIKKEHVDHLLGALCEHYKVSAD